MSAIAMFVPSMRGGGAERVMLQLANASAERGHRVYLVLCQAQGPLLAQVSTGVGIVDLDSRRVLYSLPRLVGFLKRVRPAAMLSTLTHANLVAILARKLSGVGCRLVVREANSILTGTDRRHPHKQRAIVALARHLYPLADQVIANSAGSAAEIAELLGVAPGAIGVVQNPLMLPLLREKADGAPHHPWYAPGEPPVVVAIGRLAPQKDFKTLVSAMALVRARRAARLVILGEGDERDRLARQVAAAGLQSDVLMPGFVDNPYPYLKNAALFALSSRWEGFPNALLEAAALQVPIVATDCPSGPRELLGAGSRWLVPVGDPERLAAAIDARLSDTSPVSIDTTPFALDTVVDRYHEVLGVR